MFKIKVTEKSGAFCTYIDTLDLIDRIHLMGHGLPERIVDDVEGSYDPADVLEHIETVVEEATEELAAVIKKQVKLKAEYTIEIVDISHEYELNQCIANRKAEYPTMEEFLNAYFDGGEVAVQELQAKRIAIKAKYPKP